MITVTPTARDYFSQLIKEQPDGTNLRLRVVNPGLPSADVELTFCPSGQQQSDDKPIDCQSFTLFVERESAGALDGAMIDFENNRMGGELSIRAPGLKGRKPADDASLEERVSWVLETRVNPMVASHGGRVALVEITSSNEVVLQFGGGCQGCGMIDVTLKQGIETTLRQEVPEVSGVIDATDHAAGDNPYYQ